MVLWHVLPHTKCSQKKLCLCVIGSRNINFLLFIICYKFTSAQKFYTIVMANVCVTLILIFIRSILDFILFVLKVNFLFKNTERFLISSISNKVTEISIIAFPILLLKQQKCVSIWLSLHELLYAIFILKEILI